MKGNGLKSGEKLGEQGSKQLLRKRHSARNYLPGIGLWMSRMRLAEQIGKIRLTAHDSVPDANRFTLPITIHVIPRKTCCLL